MTVEFKVGDKVVPISKSMLNPLEHSAVWKRAKIANQPYLYITKIDNETFTCNTVLNYVGGDYFKKEDLKHYQPKVKNKQRITVLEEAVATLTQQVQDMQAQIDEMMQQSKPTVEENAYGFEKPGEVTGEIGAERTHVSQLTPNELRKLIIEKAKQFVEQSLNRKYPMSEGFKSIWFVKSSWDIAITHTCEFIVNTEKRTVVALLKGINSGEIRARGIAKCDPSDVFNEHIGKAIALGRALGLDVSEFEQAVQPNEAVVGTYIHCFRNNEFQFGHTVQGEADADHVKVGIRDENDPWKHNIINDTNAQYGGVE